MKAGKEIARQQLRTMKMRKLECTAVAMFAILALAMSFSAYTMAQGHDMLLPKLAAKPSIDGELDEWQSTFSVPIRGKNYLVSNNWPDKMPGRPQIPRNPNWKGPQDLGASVWMAWDDGGIYLAADIQDDQLINDCEQRNFWHKDSFELFLDLRRGVEIKKQPIGPGWFHFVVRPPVDGEPAKIFIEKGEIKAENIEIVADRKPVTPEQVDELRNILVNWAKEYGLYNPAAWEVPDSNELDLFCGDIHMHTFYSDGTPSPVDLTLTAMYCGMDFNVITDHGTCHGARIAHALLEKFGFNYPLIIGNEHGDSQAHVGCYPLKEPLPRMPDIVKIVEEAKEQGRETTYFDELVRFAHEQGAVTTWNHPADKPKGWFQKKHLETGIRNTPFDAWEHLPPQELYDEWKAEGALPEQANQSKTSA